ncbi:unnamed protein product [Cochlearia groenlandica]
MVVVSDGVNGLRDEQVDMGEEEIDESGDDDEEEEGDEYQDVGLIVGHTQANDDEEDVGESEEDVDNDVVYLRASPSNRLQEDRNGDGSDQVAEEERQSDRTSDLANGFQNELVNSDDEDESGGDEYEDDGLVIVDNDDMDVEDDEEEEEEVDNDEVDLGLPERNETSRNIEIAEIDGHDEDGGDSRDTMDDCLPKFFKVFLPDDSGDDLEIPVSFNSFLPSPVPRNVTVRSICGNTWKLKLMKCCGDIEKFVMVDGWKRIVKDEDLKGGEFLNFEFDGYGVFNVCVYGHTTCKNLGESVKKTKEVEEEPDGEDDEASDDIIVIDDDDHDYGVDEKADGDDDDELEEADVDVDDVKADCDDDNADGEAVDDDDDNDDRRKYLDDIDNPSFTVILNPKKKSQLLIPAHVIRDYNLKFPEVITVIDPLVAKFGTLEKSIKIQYNRSVFVKGFGSIIRRNNVKTTDKMICELKKNGTNLVHTMKVYVVRGLSL